MLTEPATADAAPSVGPSRGIFLAPWDALDDDGLLAHYRAPRAVRYDPVEDPEETRADKIDALLHGRFEFNGESHTLSDPVEWLANPSADVEWHILLHKFYYAVGLGMAWQRSGDARYVRRWMDLLDDWMRITPPGFIAPDVTGRRVQNWIYSLHYFVTHDRRDERPAPVAAAFLQRMLQSIHEQVQFLCANLTPKRNHRTLELHAIFLAGIVFPEMRRAAHWREFALEQTVANVAADLLRDGVHCELSTDYHHLALRNWLYLRRLAAANVVRVPQALNQALTAALEFSMHVHKPDGIVPSLSDGDARSYLALLREGAELFGREDMRFVASQGAAGAPPARRIAHFDASGYSIVRSDWKPFPRFRDAQYMVLDCGPLGEGNHGHFDCLSFELAAFGRSLVVDPGRYTYSEAGDTNWRVRFRATAAHNTVCVDGRDQTRYTPRPVKAASRHGQGSVRHRVGGPAPRAEWVERGTTEGLDLLHGRCASHEYDAVHDRCVAFVAGRYWIVSDWMRAPTEHEYALGFQLGAAAEGAARLVLDPSPRLRSPGLSILQPARAGQVASVDASWISERYGFKLPAPAFRTRARGRDVDFDTVLVPWRVLEPVLRADDIVATGDRGATKRALRIEFAIDGERCVDCWFHARGVQTGRWRIGQVEFSGRWVHWREAADGRIVRAASHVDARLHAPQGVVPIAALASE